MSNRIKVTCQVDLYQDDDQEKGSIKVHAHWNLDDRVEIQIGDKRYLVIGSDMISAIRNCMNAG